MDEICIKYSILFIQWRDINIKYINKYKNYNINDSKSIEIIGFKSYDDANINNK